MELWLSLHGIPAQGQEFTFEDQALWTDNWTAYGLDFKPGKPLVATLFVQPQGQGCLVRGEITGSIRTACSRCAEECEQPIEAAFTHFEELGDRDENFPDESFLRDAGGVPELDVAAFLWEQFALALPDKPLCATGCQGLCPRCGANLNEGSCACHKEGGDPRMAVFRALKVS